MQLPQPYTYLIHLAVPRTVSRTTKGNAHTPPLNNNKIGDPTIAKESHAHAKAPNCLNEEIFQNKLRRFKKKEKRKKKKQYDARKVVTSFWQRKPDQARSTINDQGEGS